MEGRICVSRAKETRGVGDDATKRKKRVRGRERERERGGQRRPKDGKRIVDWTKHPWKSVSRENFLATKVFDNRE